MKNNEGRPRSVSVALKRSPVIHEDKDASALTMLCICFFYSVLRPVQEAKSCGQTETSKPTILLRVLRIVRPILMIQGLVYVYLYPQLLKH